MNIIDGGKVESAEQVHDLVDSLTRRGIQHMMVAKTPRITHWYLLTDVVEDGKFFQAMGYFGDEATFKLFSKSQVQ